MAGLAGLAGLRRMAGLDCMQVKHSSHKLTQT